MNNYIHLNYIEEIFLNTASLYSWHLSAEYELEYSNHPMAAALRNIFMLSSCFQNMKQHFKTNTTPAFLFDDLFFLWAAVPAFTEKELTGIHLLGPVFNSYASDSYIKKKLDIQNMTVKSKTELLNLICKVPVMPTAFLCHYVCQLYYILNGTVVSPDSIYLQHQAENPNKKEDHDFPVSSHTSYYYETLLLKSISDGVPIPNFSSQFASSQIGMMCPGDPLRQKKDEAISLITVFTRTAIQSGISFERAYTLSDYYIQSIEATSTVTETLQLMETMYLDVVQQVREHRLSSVQNPIVRDCMAYIDMHFQENLDIDQLAAELGYTKYYLTSRFKKESGMTVSEYLMKQRVSYAQALLANPYMDIQEISEALHFSNPSHFSATFRKLAGMTPTQYRKDCIRETP